MCVTEEGGVCVCVALREGIVCAYDGEARITCNNATFGLYLAIGSKSKLDSRLTLVPCLQ